MRVAYRERLSGSFLRWWETGLWADAVTGLDNKLQSVIAFDPWLSVYFESGDAMWMEVFENQETVPAFCLPHDIPVPAGRYVFSTVHWHGDSAPSRLLSTNLDIQYGKYFGGTLLQTDVTMNVNPNETLSVGARHVMQQIHLPAGNVSIHIESLDTSVNLTPDMYVRAQAQYDNISKAFALSVRYRWEYQPGAEILLVAGDDATLSGHYYQSHVSQLSLRLGRTFRL